MDDAETDRLIADCISCFIADVFVTSSGFELLGTK